MAYNPKDYYFHKAKKENYAARSAFKLEEIDRRFHIIRPAMKILDLGAAPGSWSQYCSRKIGSKGRILGVDLVPIKITLPNAKFLVADMREVDLAETMKAEGIEPPFDCVLSDMAPKTIGVKENDQMRSFELSVLALETARRFIKTGGTFVVKFFHSNDFEELRNMMRKEYTKVEILRPASTRKESKEIFLIGLGFKGAPASGNPV
jgi:23S rRNA (uridine2552-2'-O)-methyltransferase